VSYGAKAATRGAELGGEGRSDVSGFCGGAARVDRCGVGERTDRRSPSVRGEREGTEAGRRESKKKMYSVKYTKGVRGPSGPMRGTMACERDGPARRPGLAGLISIGKIQRVLIFEFK
jgi:hypothetical protein